MDESAPQTPSRPKRRVRVPLVVWVSAVGLRLAHGVWGLLHALYLLVFRSALYVLAAYLCLYFYLNSPHFQGILESVVDDALPGRMTASSWRWGPLPWNAGAIDWRMEAPDGTAVIEAARADGDIDLPDLAAWIVNGAILGREPFRLHITRSEARGFIVRIFDSVDGSVSIADAFLPREDPDKAEEPDAPDTGEPPFTVRLTNAVAEEGRVLLAFPGWTMDIDVEHAEADLRIGGILKIASRLVAVRELSSRVDIERFPDGTPGPLVARGKAVTVTGFRWYDMGFDVDHVRGTVEGAALSARVGMDFTDGVSLDVLAQLDAPNVPDLLHAVTGHVAEGTLHTVVRGSGRFPDWRARAVVSSPVLDVAGLPLEDVGFEASLSWPLLGDGERGFELLLAALSARGLGGAVRISDAALRTPADVPAVTGEGGARRAVLAAGATVWLDGVDLGGVLRELGVPGVPPPVGGRVTGRVRFDGADGVGADGDSFEARAEVDTDVVWGEDPLWPVAPRYGLTGTLAFAERPLPGAEGEPWCDVLSVDELRIVAGDDELDVSGRLSLASGALDVTGRGTLSRVGPILELAGIRGFDAHLRLHDARLGGTVMNPTAEVRFALGTVRRGPRLLGDASGQASYAEGLLGLRSLTARGPWGELDGAIDLQLTPRPGPRGDTPPFVAVRGLTARRLDLAALLPTAELAGLLDLTVPSARAELASPLRTFRGDATIAARDVRVAGVRLPSVAGKLHGDRGRLVAREVRATLEGGARVEAPAIELSERFTRIQASFRLPSVRLDRLAPILGGDLPVSTRVAADVEVRGRLADPELEGRVELRSAFLRLGSGPTGPRTLALGDADIHLARAAGGPLRLSSPSFFPGFTLGDESRIDLTGLTPRAVSVLVGTRAFDVGALYPELLEAEMTAAVTAEARLDVRLGSAPTWRLSVEAPEGGVRLRVRDGQLELMNRGPLRAAIDDAGVAVSGLVLHGSDGLDLTVCGAVGWDGHLDVATGGLVTAEPLRLLFRRSVSLLRGRLRVVGDMRRLPGACRSDLAWDGGALVVTGTVDAPTADGRIELLELRVQPRGFGREIALAEKAILHVSGDPATRGLVRLALAREEGLRGAVEEGTFHIWGEATLRGFALHAGRIEAEGTDLYFAAANRFNLTFNPDLTLTFEALDDPARRRSRLTGEVSVLEGTYYESFDTFTKAFGGAIGAAREQETPTRSVIEAVPWLGETTLDLRVTGANFGVTSSFPFGTTELELRIDLGLRGTLAEPLLYDRVEIVPGGTIVYKIVRREFEIVRGNLDFDGDPAAPLLDLEARAEIEYIDDRTTSLSQLDTTPATDEERFVAVVIAVKGRHPVYDLELRSDNRGFDQADLQFLVLTGAPRNPQGGVSDRSINLFTEDLANLARKMLLSAFVDAVTLGITPQGGIDWGLIASLGRNLKLRTRVLQQGDEKRYRARFEFRLTDRLSLEGQLRVQEDANQSTRTYESKLRYRIPLDK